MNEVFAPRLLLIDDEPAVLNLLRVFLNRDNYEVITTNNAQEALQLLEDPDERPVDCIITDAMMPQLSGYDFVRILRSKNKLLHIPVLMLTRKRNPEDVKKAITAGVNDYIVKPIQEQLLLDKVELCLKRAGSRQQVLDCSINGPITQANLVLPIQLVKISERDLTLHSTSPLTAETRFELKARVFDEMGIAPPSLKFIKCAPIHFQDKTGRTGYESKFAFTGLVEQDLKKIRNWLRHYEIRKQK